MTKEQLRMQMLAGIITEGQYKEKLNENEDKAPLVITVKVTQEGKSKMDLYTGPSEIQMTGGSGDTRYYYIGNQKYELGRETNIYFATYRDDIEEIQIICLALTPSSRKFSELVKSRYLNANELKNLPSDIRRIPYADCIFREGEYPRTKGVVVGGTDHRGYFEIVAVK
jgi:hypothetical protein